MILPRPQDAKHKIQMYRLLETLLADSVLSNQLQFKGGTCASLRGILDRFSVDLDFDLPDREQKLTIREKCRAIFKKLNLEVKDQSQHHLQFFLKYPAGAYERNTLKLEINDEASPKNRYEKIHLRELNLYCNAETIDTMVANKLVAATVRYEKHNQIAGRDFYDLHHFFMQGLTVNHAVVEDRTGITYAQYLSKLISFIDIQLTATRLNQDLNPLLPADRLRLLLPRLKPELIVLLQDELKRVP